MTEMTGDFQLAVKTMSRILAVKGRVVPATLSDVTLRADMEDGSVVLGEYAIPQVRKRIRKLSLVPPDPPALDEAVSAIGGADGIIIGPGSLYTSVIPNLLVPGIREAIAASSAKKLYVCNIMTQPGETDGYSVSDHVFAIEKHAGRLATSVLANIAEAPEETAAKYAEEGRFQVRLDMAVLVERGYSVVAGDYLSRGDLARHDSSELAASIMKFVKEAESPASKEGRSRQGVEGQKGYLFARRQRRIGSGKDREPETSLLGDGGSTEIPETPPGRRRGEGIPVEPFLMRRLLYLMKKWGANDAPRDVALAPPSILSSDPVLQAGLPAEELSWPAAQYLHPSRTTILR
jgi:hypothetical protein